DEEEGEHPRDALQRVEVRAQMVVAERVVELGLRDADEAVDRVEEERAPDEEDLRGEQERGGEGREEARHQLEALRPGEDEAVLEEDVGQEVGADREDPGEGVQAAKVEAAAVAHPTTLARHPPAGK